MRMFLAMLAVGLFAVPAMGAYYVAGDFDTNWDPGHANYEMDSVGGGVYNLVLANETNGAHEFKVTMGDWTTTWPTSNSKVWISGGTATITFNEDPTPGDYWLPNSERAGWEDNVGAWDIMGSFNGWAAPVATMVARGGGTDIFDVSFTVTTAGSYFFKFRKDGDWAVSIGDGFGNGSNIPYTTVGNNETVTLALDVTNGRYSLTPEPASLALLGLGGLALLRRRR